MRYRILLAALLLAGCATRPDPAAPWDANAPVEAPAVVLAEWERAENREVCAPLTIADAGERARGGTARRANFSGGWGVAWDVAGLPGREPSGAFCAACGRGVFGIAGAGIVWGSDGGAPVFPYEMQWPGGDYARYGLEAGTGPDWVAQLRVADQQCVYYVWSFLGREHLEHLIRQVRRVRRQV